MIRTRRVSVARAITVLRDGRVAARSCVLRRDALDKKRKAAQLPAPPEELLVVRRSLSRRDRMRYRARESGDAQRDGVILRVCVDVSCGHRRRRIAMTI